MRGHGVAQGRKAAAKFGVLRAAGKPCVAVGEFGQGQGVVGGRAAVNAHGELLRRHAHRAGNVLANGNLQRVRRVFVVVQTQAVLHAVGQKTGVLAAAVVVALVKFEPRRWRLVKQREQPRYMAAAAQRLVVQAGLGQHALHLDDVLVFAVMAGAHQRDLFFGKAKHLRATGFHKRQRLQRLERGARERQPMRIAHLGQ